MTVIPREELPRGLNVTVAAVAVRLPESITEVPVWIGEFEYHPEISGL